MDAGSQASIDQTHLRLLKGTRLYISASVEWKTQDTWTNAAHFIVIIDRWKEVEPGEGMNAGKGHH